MAERTKQSEVQLQLHVRAVKHEQVHNVQVEECSLTSPVSATGLLYVRAAEGTHTEVTNDTNKGLCFLSQFPRVQCHSCKCLSLSDQQLKTKMIQCAMGCENTAHLRSWNQNTFGVII